MSRKRKSIDGSGLGASGVKPKSSALAKLGAINGHSSHMPRNLSYSEKLRDPRWQRKRLEVMKRDNFTCCECYSTTRTLNVHHRFYLKARAPWEYDESWLQTLCEVCHDQRESAILAVHTSLLMATTGELQLWAKRIKKEIAAPRKAIERQAKLNPPAAPHSTDPAGKDFFERLRLSVNSLIELEEVRRA